MEDASSDEWAKKVVELELAVQKLGGRMRELASKKEAEALKNSFRASLEKVLNEMEQMKISTKEPSRNDDELKKRINTVKEEITQARAVTNERAEQMNRRLESANAELMTRISRLESSVDMLMRGKHESVRRTVDGLTKERNRIIGMMKTIKRQFEEKIIEKEDYKEALRAAQKRLAEIEIELRSR